MNALAPYMFWLKLAGLLLILSVAFCGGCSVQRSHDEGRVSKAEGNAATKSAALGQAVLALRSAAGTFRQISSIAAADKARGDAWMRAGQQAAKQATTAARKHRTEIEKLEAQLARESTTCREGSIPICGLPLR